MTACQSCNASLVAFQDNPSRPRNGQDEPRPFVLGLKISGDSTPQVFPRRILQSSVSIMAVLSLVDVVAIGRNYGVHVIMPVRV